MAEVYASKSVRGLQRWRDIALQSDVSKSAEILGWVSSIQPSESKAPLAQMQDIQWTNTERDILAYLRAKTGEDLGADPKPWIDKYAPRK